jgi:hypothetical protein
VFEVPKEVENEHSEEMLEPTTTTETGSKRVLGRVLLWILLPVTGLLVLFGLALFIGLRKANLWKDRINSYLKQAQYQSSKILLAKLNGRSYRLGQLESFKVAHLGSGLNNAIRVSDKSIKDHHLKIYRKGNDLWLKNLARSSIIANGTEIKPRSKARLVVPAVVQLNDKTKLILELLRQKQNAPEIRRAEHEPENE